MGGCCFLDKEAHRAASLIRHFATILQVDQAIFKKLAKPPFPSWRGTLILSQLGLLALHGVRLPASSVHCRPKQRLGNFDVALFASLGNGYIKQAR